jgi:hypothetical protein
MPVLSNITAAFKKYNHLFARYNTGLTLAKRLGYGVGLLLGALPMLAQTPVQPTFACSVGKSYLFQNTPTDAYEIDLLAGTTDRKTTNGLIAQTNLNAFGYNQKDGYIWGQLNGQSKLVRVGSDYSAQTFDFAAPSGFNETGFVVGDVSGNGTMYLTRGGSGAGGNNTTVIYAVNLNQAPYTATILTSQGGTYLTDWAVSPIDGNLYALYSTIVNNGVQANPAKLTLYRFLTSARTVNGVTTPAGTRETLGTVAGGSTAITVANFGAEFMDGDGSFYVVANATGNIHRISRPDQLAASDENTAIAATFITTGPAATTNNNDGARCALSRVSAAPLPVTLTAFTAMAAPNRTVALAWTTASEVNNDYFEVQHSADGITFEAVGRVAGHQTTSQASTYTFVDAAPGAAATHYYRLRQVDLDSRSTFGPVRTTHLAPGSSAVQLAVAPNPTTAAGLRVQVQVAGEASTPAVLTVQDLLGQTLLTQPVTLQPGANVFAPAVVLAPGTYWLSLRGAATVGTPGVRVLIGH